RVEAVGLCFSDLKLLHQFSNHPRKGPVVSGIDPAVLEALSSYVPDDRPTVPGHELSLRIVAVGVGVAGFRVGERWLPQPDFRGFKTAGSNGAIGYNFEGGLQEYVLLDERILNDPETGESYMIPVDETVSRAAVALVEPWGCVECSYATTERNRVKAGGRVLVVTDEGAKEPGVETCFSPDGPPAEITRIGACDVDTLPDGSFDDVIYFGSRRETIEALNDKIAAGGIINIVLGGKRIGEPVSVGVGRIHYGPTRWVGTTGSDPAEGDAVIPANGELRRGDKVAVIGAGGPMGQMHVIRAVCSGIPGLSVWAMDVDDARLKSISAKAETLARANGAEFRAVNSKTTSVEEPFTYYALMAPIPALLENAINNAAPGAVINVFAGIPAPVRHGIDLDALLEKRLFVFGTSGSETEHMRIVLKKVVDGRLDTLASVDAVSGMAGAVDGLAAVESRTLAGKILVYPMLHDLPLTPLFSIGERFPTVASRMVDGRWTRAAEEELLRVAD
ncbi:MAG TPA: alcohol dehydrogenase catalytic domain-containing protein, partial [Armatimonadota bacterium]|nr:alcohol dehydrogenase catalytic domain-containing protein [Armatimonadota bacterium]